MLLWHLLKKIFHLTIYTQQYFFIVVRTNLFLYDCLKEAVIQKSKVISYNIGYSTRQRKNGFDFSVYNYFGKLTNKNIWSLSIFNIFNFLI